MSNPLILIHGYSSQGTAFDKWKEILASKGVGPIHTLTWQSLVNEINLPDIAEGFERALRVGGGLKPGEPFDCIVHSTGMLIVRQWLARNPSRVYELKRLIALAPATFGSPVAKQGRGLLGAIFKGRKELGPDFLEAGDQILDSLELASPYTWNLAHEDLFGDTTFYGKDSNTPYVFVLCGDRTGFIGKKLAGEGSDGVVRVAGASFNSRKIAIDFRKRSELKKAQRVRIMPWKNKDSPVVIVPGADHGSIISSPDATLVDLVERALAIDTWEAFNQWHSDASRAWNQAETDKPQFQQIIIRAIDERGEGIRDYAVKLLEEKDGKLREVGRFDDSVSAYSGDKSYRAFHIDLKKLKPEKIKKLWMKVVLASGTRYAAYTGYDDTSFDANWIPEERGLTEANLEISKLLDTTSQGESFSLFSPRTTTLLELTFDREPMPVNNCTPIIIRFD